MRHEFIAEVDWLRSGLGDGVGETGNRHEGMFCVIYVYLSDWVESPF